MLSVDMVGVGRNVVSASRDGTVRLWDCGSSKCLVDFTSEQETFHQVNCCRVKECDPGVNDDAVDKMPGLFHCFVFQCIELVNLFFLTKQCLFRLK